MNFDNDFECFKKDSQELMSKENLSTIGFFVSYLNIKYKKPSREELFVNHIKNHLEDGQQVICKICGKSIDEIAAPASTAAFNSQGKE